jgi:predicted transposase YdaD
LPEGLFRLAGLPADLPRTRLEDTAVNLPELRADHVFIFGEHGDPECRGLYLEYQLQPDPRVVPDWFAKCGALVKQLDVPVVLLAIYLERGARATFPDSYSTSLGNLRNSFGFEVVRLWEHAERIRSGDLWDLAPLLVLCEDSPTEQTVRREVELIRDSGAPEEVQADLLALALRVAARDFSRGALEAIFRKELPMVQGASSIDDWIEEGRMEGRMEGREQGRTEAARTIALRILRTRFGELPPALVERVEGADAAWCEALVERAVEVESLDDLDLR